MATHCKNNLVRRRVALAAVVFTFIIGGWPVLAQSQEPPPESQPTQSQPAAPPEAAELTVEAIQSQLGTIENASDLAETVRLEAAQLYRQALEQLTLAQSWSAKSADFIKGREATPALLEAARAAVAQAASAPAVEPSDDATLDRLVEELNSADAELKKEQQTAKALEDDTKTRAERRRAIPDLLADANRRLEKTSQDISGLPGAPLAPQVLLARRAFSSAQRKAIEAEIKTYEEELRYYDARNDLLAAQRDRAALAITALQTRVAAWQEEVRLARQAEVERQQAVAQEELHRAGEAVKSIAEENKTLADERAALAAKIEQTRANAQRARETSERLARTAIKLREDVGSPGMEAFVGQRLRSQRAELRELSSKEVSLRATQNELAHVPARIEALEADRLNLLDFNARVNEALREVRESGVDVDPARLEPQVRELLTSRRELLETLKRDYDTYGAALIDLNTALTALLAKVDDLARFIDQRVLWVPSAGPITSWRTPELNVQFGKVTRAFSRDLERQPAAYAFGFLGVAALLLARSKLRSAMHVLSERVSSVHTDSYRHTVFALFYTLLLAAPFPSLFWLFAWRASLINDDGDIETYELAQKVTAAAWSLGLFTFGLDFIRHVCRARGLGESHFRWDARSTRRARFELFWFILASGPLVALVAATERHPEAIVRDTFGRLAFMVGMAFLAFLAYRLLNAGNGVLAKQLEKDPESWTCRTRMLWYPAALLTPFVLLLASAIGYHYTAVQLAVRLERTVVIIFAISVLRAMLTRWVFVQQRRLAVEQSRRKRAAQAEARAAGATTQDNAALEEAAAKLVTIGAQTRQLLNTLSGLGFLIGVWLTWADLMPALSIFENITLWTYTSEEPVTGPDGATTIAKRVFSVTLESLAIAVLLLAATFVLAKNIPGALEISILQQARMDAGGRFAFTEIARYVISIVGVTVALGVLGFKWSQVQWLVAAASVGIGFGLQEVVANFVCGLILLFERPVRVGDIVTIGEVEGKVTRIRMRATTITDWNRRELIVPNKDLVIGRLINWTLSDPVTRAIVPVGVAYGSDCRRVEELLLKVATNNPIVLDEPKPQAILIRFGDSTLEFELRVFMRNRDQWPELMHELHTAIDREFRDAGIVIAFPQRDVHIHYPDSPERLPQSSIEDLERV